MSRLSTVLVGMCLFAILAPLLGGCGSDTGEPVAPATQEEAQIRKDKSGN